MASLIPQFLLTELHLASRWISDESPHRILLLPLGYKQSHISKKATITLHTNAVNKRIMLGLKGLTHLRPLSRINICLPIFIVQPCASTIMHCMLSTCVCLSVCPSVTSSQTGVLSKPAPACLNSGPKVIL